MRVVCISDTHNYTPRHPIPDGDVLIHAGDATRNGGLAEAEAFYHWLSLFPHKHKLFVPGNHDFCWGNDSVVKPAMPGIETLDCRSITVDGVKFHGQTGLPAHNSWAFAKPRHSRSLEKVWSAIPNDTRVLVTHCPPWGILDKTKHGEFVGCELLLERVKQLSSLQFHVFGHIHEGYGSVTEHGVTFINAAICDVGYLPVHKPIIFDI